MSRPKILKQSSHADKIVFSIIGFIILVYSISLLIPIFLTINTSFLDAYDYIMKPAAIGSFKNFTNYVEAFNKIQYTVVNTKEGYQVTYKIPEMALFTIILAVGTSFMNVFLPSLTAYATAKYEFRGKNLIFTIAVTTMIIPIIGNLPSSLAVRDALGIYDNLIMHILVSGSGFGFNYILLYGAFKGLPNDYGEAAQIDGAGHFKIMFKVYYPMLMPLFLSIFLLGFVGAWNDYMTTVVYLPSYPTLAYGVYYFQENAALFGVTEPVKQAGFIIMAIPTSIIWIVSQKFISDKVTVGGLKG